jgi:hypothetical protein
MFFCVQKEKNIYILKVTNGVVGGKARENRPPPCPRNKNPEIGNFLFLDFDCKFGFKSIILLQWHSNSNQQGQK